MRSVKVHWDGVSVTALDREISCRLGNIPSNLMRTAGLFTSGISSGAKWLVAAAAGSLLFKEADAQEGCLPICKGNTLHHSSFNYSGNRFQVSTYVTGKDNFCVDPARLKNLMSTIRDTLPSVCNISNLHNDTKPEGDSVWTYLPLFEDCGLDQCGNAFDLKALQQNSPKLVACMSQWVHTILGPLESEREHCVAENTQRNLYMVLGVLGFGVLCGVGVYAYFKYNNSRKPSDDQSYTALSP